MALVSRPSPLVLQAPTLPAQTDADAALPTADMLGGFQYIDTNDGQVIDYLTRLTAFPGFPPGDKWIRQSTPGPGIPLFAHFNYNNLCYRNSVISAFMNCSPFINFVRAVNALPIATAPCPLVRSLAQIAEASLKASPTKKADMSTAMKQFWALLTARTAPTSNGNTRLAPFTGWTNLIYRDDPSNFMNHVLDRIFASDLALNVVDPDSGLTLELLFRRLFMYSHVARVPYNCECGQLKRRAGVVQDGWTLESGINFTVPEELQGKLSESLYAEKQGFTANAKPTCEVCGAEPKSRAAFYKFAYLPEVLMFAPNYQRPSAAFNPAGPPNANAGRVIFPTRLDMAQLRDDPAYPADQDTVYQLQSIVSFPNIEDGKPLVAAAHFLTWVRRPDDTWNELDDLAQASRDITLEQIRNHNYRPRVLLYTRIHPPGPNESTADTQKEQAKAPQAAAGPRPQGIRKPESNAAADKEKKKKKEMARKMFENAQKKNAEQKAIDDRKEEETQVLERRASYAKQEQADRIRKEMLDRQAEAAKTKAATATAAQKQLDDQREEATRKAQLDNQGQAAKTETAAQTEAAAQTKAAAQKKFLDGLREAALKAKLDRQEEVAKTKADAAQKLLDDQRKAAIRKAQLDRQKEAAKPKAASQKEFGGQQETKKQAAARILKELRQRQEEAAKTKAAAQKNSDSQQKQDAQGAARKRQLDDAEKRLGDLAFTSDDAMDLDTVAEAIAVRDRLLGPLEKDLAFLPHFLRASPAMLVNILNHSKYRQERNPIGGTPLRKSDLRSSRRTSRRTLRRAAPARAGSSATPE